MSRIQTTLEHLQSQRKKALIPYLMSGFPQPESTLSLMHALVSGGADIIELGIPFSDPMADGPVIQKAAEQAIANHVGLPEVLETVRSFRQSNQTTPIVLMGYANPVEQYDLQKGEFAFVKDAHECGVDGVLIVDYPPSECKEFAAQLRAHQMDLIFLLAPTSTETRMREVAQIASGYVYYVSLKGVTGSANLNTDEVELMLPKIKQHVKIPVGVGFGIRDAKTAQTVSRVSDAVVIGSKLIDLIKDESRENAPSVAQTFMSSIRSAMDQVIEGVSQ
jgi:tryptophan synthase alpha chain